jgi:hypothetical protein
LAAPSNECYRGATSGSTRSGARSRGGVAVGNPFGASGILHRRHLNPPSHRQGKSSRKVDGSQAQTRLHELTGSSPARLGKWANGEETPHRNSGGRRLADDGNDSLWIATAQFPNSALGSVFVPMRGIARTSLVVFKPHCESFRSAPSIVRVEPPRLPASFSRGTGLEVTSPGWPSESNAAAKQTSSQSRTHPLPVDGEGSGGVFTIECERIPAVQVGPPRS